MRGAPSQLQPSGAPHLALRATFSPRAGRGALLIAALLLLLPTAASACPVCFGDPNAAMSKGTQNGIFFLLGIIGFVQIGFIALFFTFWRRARALRARRESMRVIDGGQFR